MFGRGFFSSFTTKTKVTKTTRKFGPDGKVVEEVTETTEGTGGTGTPEEQAKAQAAAEEQFKKADEFFADMDKAFKKLFG